MGTAKPPSDLAQLTNPAAFDFVLPPQLIAQSPLAQRSASRLLVLDNGQLQDRQFTDLPELLQPNDLLIFNDTRVIKARLLGRKETGGQIEILIERLTSETTALAQIRASKAPKAGTQLFVAEQPVARVVGREDSFFDLQFAEPVLNVLDALGHVPLPPYIERDYAQDEDAADERRYQTVFADKPGAVAAPTAGLHFDEAMLARIAELGVKRAFVTLHVGAGTFQPLRVDDVQQHQMHAEWTTVSAQTVAAIKQVQASGGRIIAVGTTVVRALESAAKVHGGELNSFSGETRLFLHPAAGRDQFKVVDALVTNFHLPQSTLLMLVSAFAGYQPVMAAYRHAVAQQYRFFSYGDAMFVTGVKEPDHGI